MENRMTRSAVFRFPDRDAERLYKAVAPEMGSEVNPRSKANCSVEDGELVLRVEAADTAALRASLNMWLRLVNVAKEMQEFGERGVIL